jgi:excisionase family DNA binding protein
VAAEVSFSDAFVVSGVSAQLLDRGTRVAYCHDVDEEHPYLTVAEVAGLLRVNQQTVRNWIDSRSLPAVRPDRSNHARGASRH